MLREGIYSGGASSGDSVGSTITIGSHSINIEKKLADGGYAVVYLARDTYSSQKFALKRVLIRDKEHQRIVMQEVSLWRKLGTHPNIVQYIDGCKGMLANGNRVFWILCQLCTGGHLVDLMQRYGGALQQKQCLYILRETARGIKLMHDQQPPIAHRDIKIENILLESKRFKLCDFGSATTQRLNRLSASEDDIFEAYQQFEKYTTMMYRPPEMCDRYLNFNVNEKADIWVQMSLLQMLGCVAFTIAFARHPFEEQQKLAIINSQYFMGDGVSNKYQDLIRFMLTPNPQERPSIAEVLLVLENWELSTISLAPSVRKIKLEHQKKAFQKGSVKDHERDLTEEEMYSLRQKILEEQKQKEARGKISIAPNQSNMQTLIKQSMLQDRKVHKKAPVKKVKEQPAFNFVDASVTKPEPKQKVIVPVSQTQQTFDFNSFGQAQAPAFDFSSQGASSSADAFNFGAAAPQPPSQPSWTQIPSQQASSQHAWTEVAAQPQPATSFDPFAFSTPAQPAAPQVQASGFDFGESVQASSSSNKKNEGPLLEFGGEEETTKPLSILEQLGGVDFGTQ